MAVGLINLSYVVFEEALVTVIIKNDFQFVAFHINDFTIPECFVKNAGADNLLLRVDRHSEQWLHQQRR